MRILLTLKKCCYGQQKFAFTNNAIYSPLSKKEVKNPNKFQQCFRDCAIVISHQFPIELKEKVTISKFFTKSKDKLLHSITVISPPRSEIHLCQNSYSRSASSWQNSLPDW